MNDHACSVHSLSLFGTDVASPDDVHIAIVQGAAQAGGLRVVQESDVTRMQLLTEQRGVLRRDAVVVLGLRRPEVAVVTLRAVDPIVNPLRDGKELGVALSHEPPHVEPSAARVADQHLEHLGHAAARGCGVDVPEGVAVEQRSCCGGGGLERLVPRVADEIAEPCQRQRWNQNLSQPCHAAIIPDRGARTRINGASACRAGPSAGVAVRT